MKKILISTGLILILGVIGFGQKQKQQPDMVDAAKTEKSSERSSNRGARLDSGARIDGQLQSTIDVKKAKVGDEVVLKTTKSIKQDGQTVVPKGSRLIGRITDVQERSKSNGASRLGMVFDRLEGKDMSSPIRASIVSITNATANTRIGDTADADIFGSSSTSARATGGSSSGGGGLLGGVTNTAGSVLNTTTQTVGGITNTVGQTVGSTTGSLSQTVNGIQISNAVDGSVQSGTTLTAANKNIRLEKGATLHLQLNSSIRNQ